jgi:glycine/D-amino acid oxidase-like deaminating enzyme
MTVSVWQADDTQPIQEVDFLVVGAGLAGCTAAYFASQAGRKVVITDSQDIGLGATSRNAGFMITGLDCYYAEGIERYGHAVAKEIWELSLHTHKIWRDMAYDTDVKMITCGSLLLAESEAEAEDVKKSAQALKADGIDVIFHEDDPLKRGYFSAIEQPWDGAVQPYQLVNAILAKSGATFIGNNELYRIEQLAPQKVMVYTRKYRFIAQKVMLCTNAYSPRIHPYFVGKVVPTRAQVLATEPLETAPLPMIGYSDYGYMYYRTTFDNRLLIGGGRKQNKPAEDDTIEDKITDAVQAILDDYLKTRFPEVKAPVTRRWSGIMGFSVDGLPLAGTIPDMPDVGFAVGFTGHGLALGGGTAQRAVNKLLTGQHAGAVDASRLG